MLSNSASDSINMVTLGERGQVVIPAAIRDQLGLKPGDKLMTFTRHNEVICLVPASSMRRMVEVLNTQLKEMETDKEGQK